MVSMLIARASEMLRNVRRSVVLCDVMDDDERRTPTNGGNNNNNNDKMYTYMNTLTIFPEFSHSQSHCRLPPPPELIFLFLFGSLRHSP